MRCRRLAGRITTQATALSVSVSRRCGEGVEAEELRIRDRLREPRRRRRSSPRCRCRAPAAGSSARCRARAQSAASRARSSELAATPPPTASPLRAGALERLLDLDHQRSTTARWKEAARSARRALDPLGPELAHLVDERGLQPAEAEVERVRAPHPDREVERLGVALERQPVDLGAARDSRGPSAAPPCRAPRRPRRRGSSPSSVVAARGPRPSASSVWPPLAIRHRNGGSIGSGCEEVRRHVPVQVVDRHERQLGGRSERLRGRQTDQQRADQARAGWSRPPRRRPRSPVPACVERLVDHRVDQLEVVARGDLGHDAAVALVELAPARRSRC